MSIEAYRAEFLPLIERKIIDAELTLNSNILGDVVEPTLRQLAPHIGKNSFKSEQMKKLDAQYSRMVGSDSKGLVQSLHQKISQVKENIQLIERLVKKNIPNALATDTMTYKQIAIIRMIEVVGHLTTYTQQFIFYMLSAENAKASGARLDSLTNKSTIKQVETGFVGFCQTLARLVLKNDELERTIESTPDVIIAQSDEDVARSIHGTAKIDPIRNGFIGTRGNPIFKMKMAWADWLARRYHVAREMLRAYEVQLVYMLQMRDESGEVNPVLEQRIEELTALIEEQKHVLKKMEERYA